MRLPDRRWLAWPAAAVCLIGIGGIAALDLSRTGRPVAAFALRKNIWQILWNSCWCETLPRRRWKR